MSEQPPLFRTEGLCKYYPDGSVLALDQVEVAIAPGEYVAITGTSGSGKSTLLHLLSGLDTPTRGTIFFEGRPLSAYPSLHRWRATHLGLVFQAYLLIPTLTALENVMIPLFESTLPRSRWAERGRGLLDAVGLLPRANHLPGQLSGGERQRVAIARALANEPRILLADEPTGNLDSHNAAEVLDLFDRLRQQRPLTLLVVTHSTQVANRAGRVIALEDGRVVSDLRKDEG